MKGDVASLDDSERLVDQVRRALVSCTPLRIRGGDSKAFLGRPVAGEDLDIRSHRGVVNYDPTELVVTVRAGTPLAQLNAVLDAQDQMLACEPPTFGDRATVGGMIATGLAGPRRPWSRVGTRFCARLSRHHRVGQASALRRRGHEKRRRL